MYQVIQMYGDNEPWWFFTDWEKDIVTEEEFSTLAEAQACYTKYYEQLQQKYSHNHTKKAYQTAFWNDGDERYCEECEEDLQQYHGLLLVKERFQLVIDANQGKENYEAINYSRKTQCCKRSSQRVGSYTKE